MFATLQRLLARTAAIAAILFGAAVAIVLATITLIAGLVIGAIAAAAAWLGMRSRRGIPGAEGRPGRERPAEGAVIDVEMRELPAGRRADDTQDDRPGSGPARD
jgi:hypothetical protein